MKRAVLCIVQLLGLMVACEPNPSGPLPDSTASMLSFSYDGVARGSYLAVGRPTRTSDAFLTSADYAVAVTYPGELSRAGTVSIIANDKAGHADGDFIAMQGIPTRPATVSMSPYVGGILHFGLTWNESRFHSEVFYLLYTGEITVSEYSPSRVRGTFRGTAYEVVGIDVNRQRPIVISDGRFDLAVDDSNATSFRCRLFSCPLGDVSVMRSALVTLPGGYVLPQ